ncbi:hypothetical protein TorRG33x02_179420 [Trema orientale]|uniref:Uncharacterized protein n=1 Tax=Trema orientale TaxID=63057 RepID=A0A2P5EKZ8_TREOI|nr:hypothetical protein TorRG33x02_179420 [Trema orientale]
MCLDLIETSNWYTVLEEVDEEAANGLCRNWAQIAKGIPGQDHHGPEHLGLQVDENRCAPSEGVDVETRSRPIIFGPSGPLSTLKPKGKDLFLPGLISTGNQTKFKTRRINKRGQYSLNADMEINRSEASGSRSPSLKVYSRDHKNGLNKDDKKLQNIIKEFLTSDEDEALMIAGQEGVFFDSSGGDSSSKDEGYLSSEIDFEKEKDRRKEEGIETSRCLMEAANSKAEEFLARTHKENSDQYVQKTIVMGGLMFYGRTWSSF